MFGDIIQPTHLLFILVVALLVLGPKRLPEVGRSLGRGIRDFRQGIQGVEAEARGVFRDAIDEPASSVPEAAESVEAPAAAPVVAASVPSSAPTAMHVAAEPDPADYAD
jgi:sec-independent protein translocase protein TatA